MTRVTVSHSGPNPSGRCPALLPDIITAVGGGGGRTTDTIHTDATRVGSWEKFTVSCGH